MHPKEKYWLLEGGELEEHLANDCQLSIIEPMETQEYFTLEERALLYQFPDDEPETPYFDEVLIEPLENELAEEDLYMHCAFQNCEPVGVPFKTARFWVLRVAYE